MNGRVRYGMVGVGGFGAQRRARLRRCGAFEMVGGVDLRDAAFVQAERDEERPLTRYASVEAMVADARVEAVFIATPAHLHVSQALIAAQAGKAIFTEKPLGPQQQECERLVTFCEQHAVPHGHGFSTRFDPLWQEVKRLLAAGTLGRVVSVSAASMHTGGLATAADNWRFVAGMNPGGPLFQCGIHKIDLLRFLLGEGRWHAGVVNRRITASPTDDAYVLLGEFGGTPTTLHNHYVASYRHALEIYGTRGDFFITEYPVKLEHKVTDLASGFEPVHDLTAGIPPSDAEGDALRDFARAVRERRQPAMNGREGLKSLQLVFDAVAIAVERPSEEPDGMVPVAPPVGRRRNEEGKVFA
ncbi:MAG: Gfo/Idh/MocA family oxidoreductase [Lentisphaerae bacterium]|nr:Gfo/Idh/MocA family oxidoreductase [Lentisphaerota bacterium]